MSVDKTLEERGNNYGQFKTHGVYAQGLKHVCRISPGWAKMQEDQREAIEMIMHKVARLLNGNPHHIDSWHDIQGYAKLVEDRLIQEQQANENTQ